MKEKNFGEFIIDNTIEELIKNSPRWTIFKSNVQYNISYDFQNEISLLAYHDCIIVTHNVNLNRRSYITNFEFSNPAFPDNMIEIIKEVMKLVESEIVKKYSAWSFRTREIK